MKKIYFLFFALCFFTNAKSQIINIPDANFKAKLLAASPSNSIALNSTNTSIKIDVNNNGEIEEIEALNVYSLDIRSSSISDLTGISYFVNLKTLNCGFNLLSSLDLTQNTTLTSLSCYSNQITSLNVTQNVDLVNLYCNNNQITSLNVTQNTALTSLVCNNNQITSLNVTQNTALTNLACYRNFLSDLDVAQNPNLRFLRCEYNQLSSLNVTQNVDLVDLYCNNNQLVGLNVTQNTGLKNLNCQHNLLTTLDVSQNTVLENLSCYNNQLTSINVIQNTVLRYLDCQNNAIIGLDVTHNLSLENLYCSNNSLTNLDVTQNVSLLSLVCSNNQFTNLDVTQNVNLGQLVCENNSLTSLDITQNQYLLLLFCSNNQLTSLDLTHNTYLEDFQCKNNQFISLDLSAITSLVYFDCKDNLPLQSLYLKNNFAEIDYDDVNTMVDLPVFTFSGLPNLQYICADDFQVEAIQNQIAVYGYTNCHVNSYCSFVPGGEYYTIQGNNKFDENNNGCDASDVSLYNLKFNITNGTNVGSLIANTSGNYNIPVVAGTHIITPVFENSSYFTASPSTVDVTFPTQTSPFTQNFCITANGVHPDLEVSILPINAARPGFDATYKLVYKNKGNTTQSGSVNLVFNDAVLDFVSASPVVAIQSVNNLSWNFTNLAPFESREIAFTLNVNSPMETPAVNNGDVLNYTATITSPATDDMPNDNTFVFNQTVVNSYDPNDKACLEGTTIPPSKVGDYVHYMIRFENNGTANAQNIVVKDIIDANKFDINSLVPIKGSHSFVTNISAGNKVEFIFENINLPFDNANNDGYVSFKIKTKPTLTNGDTFSNSASIYFDYNFPIVTNTATTTIQALSRQDFEFSNYFKLYPNPVSSILNIDAKDTIQISSINIYNTLGQLVLVVPNAQNTKSVDISNLSSGNYFIRINSDKGTSNTKFIKQ